MYGEAGLLPAVFSFGIALFTLHRVQESDLFLPLLRNRGFQHQRNTIKTVIVHQSSKAFETDESFPQTLMPIPVASQLHLRIIQMHSHQVIHPDNVGKFLDGLQVRFFGAHVISSCKHVACIQTNTHAILVFDESDNITQFFKGSTNSMATACSILEDHFHGRGFGTRPIDSVRDVFDTFLKRDLTACASRMNVVQTDSKLFTTLEFSQEAVSRFDT
mmetsp:Transcript_18270/g.46412  ORF Transcript_18270/g.46412 Transcript_18270/m.46412 type:complete len:217 (+) Transcript_18270:2240-2890(+)